MCARRPYLKYIYIVLSAYNIQNLAAHLAELAPCLLNRGMWYGERHQDVEHDLVWFSVTAVVQRFWQVWAAIYRRPFAPVIVFTKEIWFLNCVNWSENLETQPRVFWVFEFRTNRLSHVTLEDFRVFVPFGFLSHTIQIHFLCLGLGSLR
jgi:hypothetical protein